MSMTKICQNVSVSLNTIVQVLVARKANPIREVSGSDLSLGLTSNDSSY